MKQPTLTRKTIGLLLLSSLMLPSCSDMDEYFEVPDWIGGSIYQSLQSEGNYSLFLQGVDKAGYEPMLSGKSILTVMAPDDNSLRSYLQANYNGATDFSAMEVGEVQKLIGNHILYYAFDTEKLTNFRPNEGDGASVEDANQFAGYFYKFRTRSQDPISTEFDATRQRNIQVYHNERLLPVFSYRLFQSKGIDAKENYEYFFPETGWSGDQGFNVANANVTEYEQIARNGYIYKVDRVLEPLNTIYDEMVTAGKYSRILDLYDRSEYYYYDDVQTREQAASDSLFLHYHMAPLVSIDSEWGSVTSYMSTSMLASQAYTIFAPTDQAIQDFFDDFWGEGGYSSIEEIDSVTMQEILQSCVVVADVNSGNYSGAIASPMVFPGEIANGNVMNALGEYVSIDTDEIPQADRIICSNGVLYGCSVLTPPARFRAVTGPSYQYRDYSNFNQMLSNSGWTNTLTSTAVSYVMLYPSNQQLLDNAGIQRQGGQLVSTASPNGMNRSSQTNYVLAHVAQPLDGQSTVLPTGSGTAVLPTLITTPTYDYRLYWYVKDGRITNSILHNNRLRYANNLTTDDQIWATFSPLGYRGDVDGWTNGHAYEYDNLLMPGDFSTVNDNSLIRLMTNQRLDATTEFYGWINLLNLAGVLNVSGGALTAELTLESCFMFMPTTTALETAIVAGRIPGVDGSAATVGSETFFDNVTITDRDALLEYIKVYFIPLSTASFTNYPYIGWGEDTATNGGLITLRSETRVEDGNNVTVSTTLNVYDDGTSLYITNIDPDSGVESPRVKVYGAYDYFPFVFEDGGAHFIEDVF